MRTTLLQKTPEDAIKKRLSIAEEIPVTFSDLLYYKKRLRMRLKNDFLLRKKPLQRLAMKA